MNHCIFPYLAIFIKILNTAFQPDIYKTSIYSYMENIAVVDLASTNQYNYLWDKVQKTISSSNDVLKSNYIGLDPKSFVSFPVVIKDDQIICFSGLQFNQEKWGNGVARCSSRMWIDTKYRFKHLGKFLGGTKFLNTTYSLPLQIKTARNYKFDCIFISREANLIGFKEYLKLIRINCSEDFILENSRYDVCGSKSVIPDSCKQYVALLYLTENGMSRWKENMSKHKLIDE